jgi:hypothetical protein
LHSKGKIDFRRNSAGNIDTDTIYFGDYYNYIRNNKTSFLAIIEITYSYVSVFINGKTTGMTDFHYRIERKRQKDYKIENQYGLVYNSFSPKWRL